MKISFNNYALNLLKNTILDDIIEYENNNINKTQIGGGFRSDFKFWLRSKADPIHDFKRKHSKIPDKKNILLDLYDVLLNKSGSGESLILLNLIQDKNCHHGIPLKYMSFYSFDKTSNQIWKEIDNEFNTLGNTRFKYYIFNAMIKGINTDTEQVKSLFKKIMPLPAYWDPLKGRSINFKFKNSAESELFYKELYKNVCSDLLYYSNIEFILYESTFSNDTIVIYIKAPNNNYNNFSTTEKGFPLDLLKMTILNLINNIEPYTLYNSSTSVYTDSESTKFNKYNQKNVLLEDIIKFLKENGADKEDIISFIMVSKMSGDAGVVEFIRMIDKSKHKIIFNDKEEDLDTKDRPIIYLSTGDSLCAANAIISNVKCVFKYNYINDKKSKIDYLAQYLGNKYTFNINNFLSVYINSIDKACKLLNEPYNYISLDVNDQIRYVPTICNKLIYLILKKQYVYRDINIDRSKPDDYIKYIISINGIIDFATLDNVISDIIKKHLSKSKIWNSQSSVVNLNSLNILDQMYTYYNTNEFFTPLLNFFKTILYVEDIGLKKDLYDYLQAQFQKKLKLAIDSNGLILNDLNDNRSASSQEVLFEDENML